MTYRENSICPASGGATFGMVRLLDLTGEKPPRVVCRECGAQVLDARDDGNLMMHDRKPKPPESP